jgi:hypothetical protein
VRGQTSNSEYGLNARIVFSKVLPSENKIRAAL